MWFEFLDDLREQGVTTPVIPGIMPVLNVKSVKRMAEMSGADFPAWLEHRLRAVEDDEDAMRAVGIEATTELCQRPHGRWRRLVPLLHAEPVVGDPRDLREPRLRRLISVVPRENTEALALGQGFVRFATRRTRWRREWDLNPR